MRLPFTPDTPIETDRLVLRPFEQSDLDAVAAIQGDPDAVRYVPYPVRDRVAMAEELPEKIARTTLREDGSRLDLAVLRRDTGELIGDVMLAVRSAEHGNVEVGYIFAAGHGGQGFATESVRALLDVAFGALGARRVTARVDARNTASIRLLQRLGVRQEALLVENEYFKGELSSEADFAILAREWAR